MDPAALAQVLGPALVWLDYAGVFVFAASGALLAARKRQTLVTFIFFAVITGVCRFLAASSAPDAAKTNTPA
jgi:hypothetical protein